MHFALPRQRLCWFDNGIFTISNPLKPCSRLPPLSTYKSRSFPATRTCFLPRHSTTKHVRADGHTKSASRSKHETQAIFDGASGGETPGAEAAEEQPGSSVGRADEGIPGPAVGRAEGARVHLAAWGERLLLELLDAVATAGLGGLQPLQRLACQAEVRLRDWSALSAVR